MGLFDSLKGLMGGKAEPIGSHVLETRSFRIELPVDWKVNLKTDPVSARGPDGQMLEVSSFEISGPGPSAELEKLRASIRQSLHKTMVKAAGNDDFAPGTSIQDSTLADGVPFVEGHARAADNSFLFAQFGLVGPRTALYINGRFRPDAAELQRIKGKLESIVWL